jgi:ribonuclease Y
MNLIVIYPVIGILLGIVLGYFIRQIIVRRRLDSAEIKIENQLEEAKRRSREIVISAKDKAVSFLEEAKKEEKERQRELSLFEKRLNQREEILNQKITEIENQRKEIELKVEKLKNVKSNIERAREEAEEKLEKISGFSREEAKKELVDKIQEESKLETIHLLQRLEKEKREEIEKQAGEIILSSLQRFSRSNVGEITTSFVNLPNEEMKGKIIGHKGRNIRELERTTGVDFIIDESPDIITLSCFDPIRREIAKIALEKLMRDGRIQPARIEEKVEEAKEEINQKIKEIGENAVYETGILDLPKEIIYLLGRLNYRTSYGQNILQHSIESTHLAGMIAAELNANIEVAKRAALLHDIGKAIDHEVEGTHVELGRRILKKYGISEEVIKAMESHHEDYPFETPESFIVAAAESASASRPGARRDTLKEYIKRLEELEKIAYSFKGVENVYAIRAGREVRVFVSPEKMDDLSALNLAKEIANRIQEELSYPGEIKVNVIRETRAVEYAR